jgi:hypothetical protein
MFLARFLSSVVTFCSDRPPFKMADVTKNRNYKKKSISIVHCCFSISQNEFLFLVTSAILNGGRSEQKVTTLDKDLARNISAKYGFNPSSGS